ncbi:hypothetical protein IGI04_013913, partial [Brassica rapa subsp. trilocularis]
PPLSPETFSPPSTAGHPDLFRPVETTPTATTHRRWGARPIEAFVDLAGVVDLAGASAIHRPILTRRQNHEEERTRSVLASIASAVSYAAPSDSTPHTVGEGEGVSEKTSPLTPRQKHTHDVVPGLGQSELRLISSYEAFGENVKPIAAAF